MCVWATGTQASVRTCPDFQKGPSLCDTWVVGGQSTGSGELTESVAVTHRLVTTPATGGCLVCVGWPGGGGLGLASGLALGNIIVRLEPVCVRVRRLPLIYMTN